ncbi:MAG: MGMT family protein [Chloroflexi bacterium]|nr:MGMT family protein [Chloroflexota bacterium]
MGGSGALRGRPARRRTAAAQPHTGDRADGRPRRGRACARRGTRRDSGRRERSRGRPAGGVRLDWTGITPFRRAVLEECARIPAGETRSYGWLAEQVGHPRAARAVGRVMATNPWPLFVPCHRVVGSDGSLHGYGGGLPMKDALLRAEGAR